MREVRLSACPQPGGGVHYWLLSAAHQWRKAGLTEEQAEALIADHMTRPTSRPNEVTDAVRLAYSPSSRNWKRPAGATRKDSSPDVHQTGANLPERQLPPRKPIDIECQSSTVAIGGVRPKSKS